MGEPAGVSDVSRAVFQGASAMVVVNRGESTVTLRVWNQSEQGSYANVTLVTLQDPYAVQVSTTVMEYTAAAAYNNASPLVCVTGGRQGARNTLERLPSPVFPGAGFAFVPTTADKLLSCMHCEVTPYGRLKSWVEVPTHVSWLFATKQKLVNAGSMVGEDVATKQPAFRATVW